MGIAFSPLRQMLRAGRAAVNSALVLLALLTLSAQFTQAQTRTIVTGNIIGADGVPWTGAQLTGVLITPGGASPSLTPCTNNITGCPLQNPVPPTVLGPGGAIQGLALWANASILPASTTYTFTVSTSGVPPPLGTGPQSCTLAGVTIAGATQTLVFSGCPALTNAPGAAGSQMFNVKGFGVRGDTQFTNTCSVTSGQPLLTCTGVTFTPADVGKRANAVYSGTGVFTAGGTIIAYVSSTSVNLSSNSSQTQSGLWGWWGHLDDPALANTWTAVQAAAKATNPQNNTVIGIAPQAPTLYFPAGVYMTCSGATNGLFTLNSSAAGIVIMGDSGNSSVLVPCDTPAAVPYNYAYFFDQLGGTIYLHDFGIFGLGFNINVASAPAAGFGSGSAHWTQNLVIGAVNDSANVIVNSGTGYDLNDYVYGGGGGGANWVCNFCSGTIEGGDFSNDSASSNLIVENVGGGTQSPPLRLSNLFVDECFASGVACTQFINAVDVYAVASTFLGGTTAMSCDATSSIHLIGTVIGPYGSNSNATGIAPANGCRVAMESTRAIGELSGYAINNSGNANGKIVDLGDNRIQMFAIATAGSESSSTVTFTLSNNPTTDGCYVGGTLDVQGGLPAGYNGTEMTITAVSSTQISYTANVTGLGSLTQIAQVYCNRIGYNGYSPKSSVTHSVFNCNVPTLTSTTTPTTTNCFWIPDQDVQIPGFNVGLVTAPSGCSTNAVLTATNGTNSITLTLSSQQPTSTPSQPLPIWRAGTAIDVYVSTAAAGCSTSPANASINLLWASFFMP